VIPVADTRSVYERAARLRPQVRHRLVDGSIDRVQWFADRPGFVVESRGPDGIVRTAFEIASGQRDVLAAAPGGPFFEAAPRDVSLTSVEDDLWLTAGAGAAPVRLTADGVPERSWSSALQAISSGGPAPPAPIAVWSPDGRYAVTQRSDYRGVRATPITESAPEGGGDPLLHLVRAPFPGDAAVPLAEVFVVDVAARAVLPAAVPPLACTHSSPLRRGDVWWNTRGTRFYVVESSRDWLHLTLWEVDPASGEARVLLREDGGRRIRPAQSFHQRPNVRVLTDAAGNASEIVWFSERDGWGHLYRYDASGRLLGQITRGDFVVQEILHLDPVARTLLILVSGLVAADPYRQTPCAVPLEGGELRRLTDDHLDHRAIVPPDPDLHGGYIDCASTVDTPPVATFRGWNGAPVLEVARADVSALEATGWQRPQRFRAVAADGSTPIYGTLFLPPDFDPAQRYPVLDHVYPGPQMGRCDPSFAADDVEPMAALGIVGVAVDGRGTPGRSRAFYDHSWENVGAAAGIEDHVAAIRHLASTRPWMDAARVGVYGRSAGGFGAARAMELFPDFYRVGIAASGRFEGRIVMGMILEAYDHPTDAAAWARASAIPAAGAITGKLLVVHGELDRAVTIHHALRLIDRLIEANRDFDLLVVPGDDHVYTRRRTYVERRMWDYLTRHLLQREPPASFRIPAE
jgi:YD repeat-containing protein